MTANAGNNDTGPCQLIIVISTNAVINNPANRCLRAVLVNNPETNVRAAVQLMVNAAVHAPSSRYIKPHSTAPAADQRRKALASYNT